MALQFEKEILFYTSKGLSEDKITITSMGVWCYLSHEIYGKNNQYVFQAEISAATKLTILK